MHFPARLPRFAIAILTTASAACGSGSDETAGASGGGGTGGANGACKAGVTEICYEGPAGTQDVGRCRSGTRTCDAAGTGFGPCLGQVLPAAETCGTPEDDDCDGATGDAADCVCAPGTIEACPYNGPPGTEGVGVCKSGQRSCNAMGTAWSACTGEVIPGPENCQTPDDENCGGAALDGCGEPLWGTGLMDMVPMGIAGDTVGGAYVSGFATPGGHVLLRIGPSGAVLWTKTFGGQSTLGAPWAERGNQVGVDPAGNVLVTGGYEGIIDFGCGVLTSAGSSDIFLAKFDASGTCIWAKGFGDAALQHGLALAVDMAGNVAVAGRLWGTADLGGGQVVTSGGDDDALVAKFDAQGTALWSHVYGGDTVGGDEAATSVAFDPDGNLYVAGTVTGPTDFGGGVLPGGFVMGAFIVKLDPAGGHVYSRRFSSGTGTQTVRLPSVAVDAAGAAALAVGYSESIDLDGTVHTSTDYFDNNIAVARLSQAGAVLWSRSFGTSAQMDYPRGVAVDAGGDVVLAGIIDQAVDFGGGPVAGTGERHVMVAKLDGGGAHVWSKAYGCSTSHDEAQAIAVTPSGELLLAAAVGYPANCIDLGSGPLAMSADAFVAKFAP